MMSKFSKFYLHIPGKGIIMGTMADIVLSNNKIEKFGTTEKKVILMTLHYCDKRSRTIIET